MIMAFMFALLQQSSRHIVFGPAFTVTLSMYLNTVSCRYQNGWDIKQTVEHTWIISDLAHIYIHTYA